MGARNAIGRLWNIRIEGEVLAQATDFILKLSCADRTGIVAAVSQTLFELGGNILDAQQFNSQRTQKFFMRVLFSADFENFASLKETFAEVASRFAMDWTLRPQNQKKRVALLVSKFDHCLADLLYRWRIGELSMDIIAIIANHPRETYAHLDFDGVPFHYLPVSAQTKFDQEQRLYALLMEVEAEVVVLARYMQVLSEGLATKLLGRCINIHHSFLPGFKGAKPYRQAYDRGVKLIGASAHYVTRDLDEGPIIEQDVDRVTHRDGPEDLVRKGRDIERRVLARALRYHLEDRVLIDGRTTVVFYE